MNLVKEGRKESIPQKTIEKKTSKEASNQELVIQPKLSESIALEEKIEETKRDLSSEFKQRIEKALAFYINMLEKEKNKKILYQEEESCDNNQEEQNDKNLQGGINTGVESDRPKLLSSKEVAEAMAKCVELPVEKQMETVSQLEEQMDLTDFGLESEWTIDITEEAHKFFKKNIKRRYHFCERVIRRLKLLSTGRWPYVLCKPLNTKKTSVKLYETKIDTGSRIIWEVAISFSPRRSSIDHRYCEQ